MAVMPLMLEYCILILAVGTVSSISELALVAIWRIKSGAVGKGANLSALVLFAPCFTPNLSVCKALSASSEDELEIKLTGIFAVAIAASLSIDEERAECDINRGEGTAARNSAVILLNQFTIAKSSARNERRANLQSVFEFCF